MKYWQHETPIKCPKGHKMLWLGGIFWACAKCKSNKLFIQVAPQPAEETKD